MDSSSNLSTGLKGLDRLCCGLQKANLYLIAARPAMGKTALALTIARHIALQNNRPVFYFAPGLSEKHLLQLLLSAESDIELQKISTNQLTRSQTDKLTEVARQVNAAPLYFFHNNPLTINTISREIQCLQKQCKPEVIFIDYLQLMIGKENYSNRKQMNIEIISDLKNMAEKLKIPVLLLSQLTRNLEERTDRRPIIGDLLVYGDIANSADLVIFIYRDKYYHKDGTKSDIAEIKIAKNRSGHTGSFELLYLDQYKKFIEFDQD